MSRHVDRLFRPMDWFFAVLILLSGIWVTYAHLGAEGSEARIYVGNQKVAWYRLSGDSLKITLQSKVGQTVLERRDGGIRVVTAPCVHQICKKRGAVSKTHEKIICMPGQLLVKIVGEPESLPENQRPDAVSF